MESVSGYQQLHTGGQSENRSSSSVSNRSATTLTPASTAAAAAALRPSMSVVSANPAAVGGGGHGRMSSPLISVLLAAIGGGLDSAQNILEDHLLRVWDETGTSYSTANSCSSSSSSSSSSVSKTTDCSSSSCWCRNGRTYIEQQGAVTETTTGKCYDVQAKTPSSQFIPFDVKLATESPSSACSSRWFSNVDDVVSCHKPFNDSTRYTLSDAGPTLNRWNPAVGTNGHQLTDLTYVTGSQSRSSATARYRVANSLLTPKTESVLITTPSSNGINNQHIISPKTGSHATSICRAWNPASQTVELRSPPPSASCRTTSSNCHSCSSSSNQREKAARRHSSVEGHVGEHQVPAASATDVSSNSSSSSGGGSSCSSNDDSGVTIVAYYICDEPIPYRTTLSGRHPTLAQFKQLVVKRGSWRYFFRKASDEFDSGVVHEEVTDDSALLPLWDGKVIGKIERIQ